MVCYYCYIFLKLLLVYVNLQILQNGPLPSFISTFTNLKLLDLTGNAFSGDLFSEWGNFKLEV